MSDNDDFMCEDEEDYGLVSYNIENNNFVSLLTKIGEFVFIIISKFCISAALLILHFICRNTRKIVTRNRMLIWKINTTIAKH